MYKFLFTLLALCFTVNTTFAGQIDQKIDAFVSPVSNFVSGIVFYPVPIFGSQIPATILWILIGGIFVTFYLRGISIWGFTHAVKLITRKQQKYGTEEFQKNNRYICSSIR